MWRAEYGPELEDLLRRQPPSLAVMCNVLWSAFRERARQPLVRFFLLSLLGSGCVFVVTLVFAGPIWRVLSAPVAQVLREQGARPPALVALRPLEQLEVVWLGIPLLLTAFASYPYVLLLAWSSFARTWRGPTRRLVISFAVCSGTLFVLSFFISFVAWQHGSLAKLLEIAPEPRNAPMVSIGHCFDLLAASTLGTALLIQIPVCAFYGWRFTVAVRRECYRLL
jgi:Sec-independent protein secretion pathway component TatC